MDKDIIKKFFESKEHKNIVRKAAEQSCVDMNLMMARYEASKARDEKLKKVIADNKEKWIQSLTYMADERIEDPEWVIEGHIDLILDDLINKMK